MHIWPQIFILGLYGSLVLASIIKHGENYIDPKISAFRMIWQIALVLFVLSMGGFWQPLGW